MPEPRKVSESLPLLVTSLFDLHLHDRGSVGFPAEFQTAATGEGSLFEPSDSQANLAGQFWQAAREDWELGNLDNSQAKRFIRQLFRVCLSICHSTQYGEEHRESLAQDWAHVPIPRDKKLFEELANTGDLIATLLNPLAESRAAIRSTLGNYAPRLAVLASTAGGAVRESDLVVTISHFGAARGGWRPRQFKEDEIASAELGQITGDLCINDQIFFRNARRLFGAMS